MRNPEYLFYDPTESIVLPDWSELVCNSEVLSPKRLFAYIEEAKTLLMNAWGPNLTKRRVLTPLWLDPWLSMLKEMEGVGDKAFCHAPNVVDFSKVKQLLETKYHDLISGFVLGAGWEGTDAHMGTFLAMKVRSLFIQVPVFGFEQDAYHERYKTRGAPFFPLSIRLSMWQHFVRYNNMDTTVLTVIPPPDIGANLTNHYQRIHDATGCHFHLAVDGDEHFYEKVSRGALLPDELMPLLTLPRFSTGSTSERSQKLLSKMSTDFDVDDEVDGDEQQLFFEAFLRKKRITVPTEPFTQL